MMTLDKELEEYAKKDIYPFHMPGHKRIGIAGFDPYSVDITEIPEFDDLHDAKGIIAKLQQEYANLYKAKEAFLSVNGSTLGNLAAIFVATERGDEIIVGSNCHRSVVHAAELNGLNIHYIEPKEVSYHIQGQISPGQVEDALSTYPDTKLVVITSPTYEGIISDIDEIVRIAHRHGAAVHIDGAHGAHHGLGGLWEKPIIASGADTTVLSLHKTLPAFTGSSVILTSSKSRTSKERLEYYIDCFETSSPSYILMYGMAACLSYIKDGGRELFCDYGKRLLSFYDEVSELKKIEVCRFMSHDISKIVIAGRGNISGENLAELLRRDYKIEIERVGESYCLALSSVMDDKDAFGRLSEALKGIDKNI